MSRDVLLCASGKMIETFHADHQQLMPWFVWWRFWFLFAWRRPTRYAICCSWNYIIHWINICINRHSIPSSRPNSIPGRFDAKFCLRGPFQCWECVLHILDLVVHVPSPPALSVHSQLPCLDTLEKERTQFACLLNLGCQCFLFSLNCVQRTFLFSTQRETGQCNEPRASMEHQCGWFSDIFAPETMQPRVFLLFVSLALWVLYIHSHSRPFSTCHTSYIGHGLVLVTSNRHW